MRVLNLPTKFLFRLQDAATDLLTAMRSPTGVQRGTTAFTFKHYVWPGTCPKTAAAGSCAKELILSNKETLYASTLGPDGNLILLNNDVPVLDLPGQYSLSNLANVFHAAVRLDIGYVLPDNLLVNASAVNIFLHPLTNGTLYPDLQSNTTLAYPLPSTEQAVIDTLYQCTFKSAKSPGEIFIAVLVATASLFGTGWSILMFAASYAAKKVPDSEFSFGDALTY